MGNKRAKEIERTTGVSTANGDIPYRGPEKDKKHKIKFFENK